jgi:hypothetical protein
MPWIELEGAVNVRDLGGLPTSDGGKTVGGRLLRADNLQELSPADVATLVREVLEQMDARYGGVVPWLGEHGFSAGDLDLLHARLRQA